MKKTRILFVEDDLDYRYLIERELEKEKDFELCAACSGGCLIPHPVDDIGIRADEYHAALLHQPDIVLMDLSLGNSALNGAEAAREIRLQTDSRVIILTSHENYDTVIHASTQALASAYLFKSNFSVLIPTIRETARGVTPQAQLICSALLAPLTNAERSVLLRILGEDVSLHSSSKTISNQQTGILRKLDLPGRRELTHIFKAYGFQKAENSPVSF